MRAIAAAVALGLALTLSSCAGKSDDQYNLDACKKVAVEVHSGHDLRTAFQNIAKIGAQTPTKFGTDVVNYSNAILKGLQDGTNSLGGQGNIGQSITETCSDLGVEVG